MIMNNFLTGTNCKLAMIFAVLFSAAGDFSAHAQASSAAEFDSTKLAGFISERNIFDPNRVPRASGGSAPRRITVTRPRTHASGTPHITLVGMMSYEKGWFAFFNAGDSENKKVLAPGGDIGGNTIKTVAASEVTLIGADKKEFTMQIGDQLQPDGSRWKLVDRADVSHTTNLDSAPATTPEGATAPADAPAATAPPANLEGNDILKRLMEKRAQEEK